MGAMSQEAWTRCCLVAVVPGFLISGAVVFRWTRGAKPGTRGAVSLPEGGWLWPALGGAALLALELNFLLELRLQGQGKERR